MERMVLAMADIKAQAENVNGRVQLGTGDIDTSNNMLRNASVGGDVKFDETVTVNVAGDNKAPIFVPKSAERVRADEEIRDKRIAEFKEGASKFAQTLHDNSIPVKIEKAVNDFNAGVDQTKAEIKEGFNNLKNRFSSIPSAPTSGNNKESDIEMGK